MDIKIVTSKKEAATMAVSTLLFKMANADSANVAGISKELRKWYRVLNRESRFHQ